MFKAIGKWLRERYTKIVGSIAFFPAIIAICFLGLSYVMLELDFSPFGKHLKSQLSWVSLKDASTARTIISTIVGGIISLTVFSFSMVMIVLNQAASQMSNRVLSSMIENRFQQIVLGFYIGTIVYALFLLSTIRDINSGIYVPALSIYLLILLTVIDIFFFIYFLDYVTQTVKYETVIHRVQEQTLNTMKKLYTSIIEGITEDNQAPYVEIQSPKSGYFQSFNCQQLLKIAKEQHLVVSFLYAYGTYIVKGSPLLKVYGKENMDDDLKNQISKTADFYDGQPIKDNPEYGFRHLTEIALKALSPGINDPATAVLSLNVLSDLFAYRLRHSLPTVKKDDKDRPRIFLKTFTFKELFKNTIFPIWSYGKDDYYIQKAMLHLLNQLKGADEKDENASILNVMTNKVIAKMEKAAP